MLVKTKMSQICNGIKHCACKCRYYAQLIQQCVLRVCKTKKFLFFPGFSFKSLFLKMIFWRFSFALQREQYAEAGEEEGFM